MTTFYFIRHGQMKFAEANTKFYKDMAFNMVTLSDEGVRQIKETAKDKRLLGADIILASPFGRTMHSAAILSKELGVDLVVETDLHEWMADAKNYRYLSDEEAKANYEMLTINKGVHPKGKVCNWESAAQMKERVNNVLSRYMHMEKVIVVCHGTLMQYVLDIEHPENGQIAELTR